MSEIKEKKTIFVVMGPERTDTKDTNGQRITRIGFVPKIAYFDPSQTLYAQALCSMEGYPATAVPVPLDESLRDDAWSMPQSFYDMDPQGLLMLAQGICSAWGIRRPLTPPLAFAISEVVRRNFSRYEKDSIYSQINEIVGESIWG